MKEIIAKLLKEHIKIKDIENLIEIPSNSMLGDFSFPTFIIAKDLKRNPRDIASVIAEEISKNLPKEIEQVKSVNGYINFFVNKKILSAFTNTISTISLHCSFIPLRMLEIKL